MSNLKYEYEYFKKYEINGPMNLVSYAQIAFEQLIFQARPANAHAESYRAYTAHVRCLV